MWIRSKYSSTVLSKSNPTSKNGERRMSMLSSSSSTNPESHSGTSIHVGEEREYAAIASLGDAAGAGRIMDKLVLATGRRKDRMPLFNVVVDYVRRWFRDSLEEARPGMP
ncbi:hypothetical protein IEQ34_026378 [Dendrobium chrysotoxum]|uniref:Uncharacterized protein n=1 Tax=Dendrobium chrysotoxum TaxID=161865 RepID=A0AAV7FME1_DENCH|nr:hypothetical protein IEQ34_026378 [Dendrobium chrysotoxum]